MLPWSVRVGTIHTIHTIAWPHTRGQPLSERLRRANCKHGAQRPLAKHWAPSAMADLRTSRRWRATGALTDLSLLQPSRSAREGLTWPFLLRPPIDGPEAARPIVHRCLRESRRKPATRPQKLVLCGPSAEDHLLVLPECLRTAPAHIGATAHKIGLHSAVRGGCGIIMLCHDVAYHEQEASATSTASASRPRKRGSRPLEKSAAIKKCRTCPGLTRWTWPSLGLLRWCLLSLSYARAGATAVVSWSVHSSSDAFDMRRTNAGSASWTPRRTWSTTLR